MRILFLISFILSLFTGYCFGMEKKESTDLLPVIPRNSFIIPHQNLQYYLNSNPINSPQQTDFKSIIIQPACQSLPFQLAETLIMPFEFLCKKLDIINEERYGKKPVDPRIAQEIRKNLEKSRLSREKAHKVKLYKLTNPQEQDSLFLSMPSGSTWVNEKAYEDLSEEKRQSKTIAEGNSKALHVPAAKIIIPGTLGLGAIYIAKKAYYTYTPHQYQQIINSGSRMVHNKIGKAVGYAGLYLITRTVLFNQKSMKKITETGIEKAGGDPLFDSLISYNVKSSNENKEASEDKNNSHNCNE